VLVICKPDNSGQQVMVLWNYKVHYCSRKREWMEPSL